MAEKQKITDRDATLVNILERMASQLQKQAELLEDIVKRQDELSISSGKSERRRDALYRETDSTYEKIGESLTRYRSDMLSLVNEQDHINSNITDLRKMIKDAAFSLEKSAHKIEDLDARINTQSKEMHEHFEHSLRQAEILPKEFADVSRNVTKHHMDAEKAFGKMHHEAQRSLEKSHQETTRRLLALDGIEASLQTLLIRTEPPEKKTPWIVRLFKKIGRFFRTKLPQLFRLLFSRRKV